jgi:glycosyltransferase involved in cell wall biosynthesis
MKVIVDGFNLALAQGTGIATYARNLTYNLKDLGHELHVLYGLPPSPDQSATMREISFYDDVGSGGRFERFVRPVRQTIEMFGCVTKSLSPYEIPVTGLVINQQFAQRLPRFDQMWNVPMLFERAHRAFHYFGSISDVGMAPSIDIAHWTYPVPVKVGRAKNIYTLHDLIPLRLPHTTVDRRLPYWNLMKRIAKNADQIVTVSENSKRDIVELLNVPEQKVTNTYQAVEIPDTYLNVPVEQIKQELDGVFQLQYKNYVLFYGAIEPKKNVGRLIEAFLASNSNGQLVIAGASAWKSDQELRLLTELGGNNLLRKGKIVRIPYLPFSQLVNLIRGASAVVFPSLYEGFGLPILESMLCGTPVITSNLGSMKEVAGDAALLVDPYNTREIKDAIVTILSDSSLQAKKVMLGRKVAAGYSPDRYKERLMRLYANVTGSAA